MGTPGKQLAGRSDLQPDRLTRPNSRNRGSRLWIQGGTTTDPLLDDATPPFDPAQAFGALRCSIDNLNGDNVEWIGYPQGTTHVFCYYFTVSPAPDAATIVVKKTLKGGSAEPSVPVPGQRLLQPRDPTRTTPTSTPSRCTRAVRCRSSALRGCRTGTSSRSPTSPIPLQDVVCSTANGDVRDRQPRPRAQARRHPVRILYLSPGSTVTCEFINADEAPPEPAKARIAVDKVTANGVGTFLHHGRPSGTCRPGRG